MVSLVSGCLHLHQHGSNNDLSESLGRYPSRTVIPDGLNKEWDKSILEYDTESKISYSITNDSKNLYVLIATLDIASQFKILNRGLSLTISPSAKKKAAASLYFPVRTDGADFSKDSVVARTLSSHKLHEQALTISNRGVYELKGFRTGNGSYSKVDNNKAGIQVALGFDLKNEMVYEAIIPFTSLFVQNDAAMTGKIIKVGFKINGTLNPLGATRHRSLKSDTLQRSSMGTEILNVNKIEVHRLNEEVTIWRKFVLWPK